MFQNKIKIKPFKQIHQEGIDQFMLVIVREFPNPITIPAATKIIDKAFLPNNKYWVALYEEKVVGTVGLMTLSNQSISLKSMFLASEHRGLGIGQLFLATVKAWCATNNYTQIYLGTMTQFKSGQRFYEKNQFKRMLPTDLPSDFPFNPLDKVYYYCNLKEDTSI